MSIALYVLGFAVLIGGIAWAASLLGLSQTWIIVGVVVMAGIAILAIAGNMARREPPPRNGGTAPPP